MADFGGSIFYFAIAGEDPGQSVLTVPYKSYTQRYLESVFEKLPGPLMQGI
jgi:hypothetical protein